MEDCCDKEGKMGIGKIILWVVIALLVIVVIYTTFISGSGVGAVANIPSSGGMVGGC